MTPTKFPFKPVQAGYSVTFGDGTQRIALDGGSGRYRAGVADSTHMVPVSWVLRGDDYSAFMGAVRNVLRSGGTPFEIDLIIDEAAMKPYRANFMPGTVKLVSKQGKVYTVSATLEVEAAQAYTDPSLDYWGSVIMLLVIYGSIPAAREILNMLAKLANEDLPDAHQQ